MVKLLQLLSPEYVRGVHAHNEALSITVPVQVCVPLPPWAIRAGARETIYHDPLTVNAAIVTCGGLCPGLNDVVQGLVRKLEDYGVPDGNILGIRSAPRSLALYMDHPAAMPCLAVVNCAVVPTWLVACLFWVYHLEDLHKTYPHRVPSGQGAVLFE